MAGCPPGDTGFVEQLEQTLNRTLRLQKRGPKGPWKHKTKGDISIVSPELRNYSRNLNDDA